MQDAIQKNRENHVTISNDFDPEIVNEILKQCGVKSLYKQRSYLGVAKYRAKPGRFVCIMRGTDGFAAGTIGKHHFRLIDIAVRQEHQGKGYGTELMVAVVQMCKKKQLAKITFRTNRHETAPDFYKKFGGKIIGTKGEDYEMEIPLCFTS